MCTVDDPETESESDSNRLETLCKAPPALPVCNQTFHSQHIDRGSLSLRPIADVCGSVIAADARCSSLLVPVYCVFAQLSKSRSWKARFTAADNHPLGFPKELPGVRLTTLYLDKATNCRMLTLSTMPDSISPCEKKSTVRNLVSEYVSRSAADLPASL